MIAHRGPGRGSHIAGLSVHYQRIEHLWRDVYRCVSSSYHDLNDTSCLGEDYGVDPTGPLPVELAVVVIPRAVHPLSDAQLTTFMDLAGLILSPHYFYVQVLPQ